MSINFAASDPVSENDLKRYRFASKISVGGRLSASSRHSTVFCE